MKAATLMIMLDPRRPDEAGRTLLELAHDASLDADGREWAAEAAGVLGLTR
jgi:hypothetical protein